MQTEPVHRSLAITACNEWHFVFGIHDQEEKSMSLTASAGSKQEHRNTQKCHIREVHEVVMQLSAAPACFEGFYYTAAEHQKNPHDRQVLGPKWQPIFDSD
ncbi:hypothetical protein PFICI_12951 [Pestalotiopsis fici W106-1]|uniref:Uncharacterized protein n=1 Tax=Pestalotiopsis fici (strain W106-1 / CGMCC3.15140) TaxID=1229662 RepID=W3WS65_PESFW|nr:uncharacterized protein PFICI_12951 [Pestalotiopsis fici W106-1]ETS76007.1 hypothetical protein PFICI_12951 [Pestalotiopsis fici W106-1]